MASLTIRNLDERTKQELRIRAARHGRSMEEEARNILRDALTLRLERKGLGSAINELFKAIGGSEVEPLPREPLGHPTLPLQRARSP